MLVAKGFIAVELSVINELTDAQGWHKRPTPCFQTKLTFKGGRTQEVKTPPLTPTLN